MEKVEDAQSENVIRGYDGDCEVDAVTDDVIKGYTHQSACILISIVIIIPNDQSWKGSKL